MSAAVGDASGTRIPVQHKKAVRAQFLAQLAQDIPAVLTVLTAGASAIICEGGALALAAAELLVGAWVLFTIAAEARHAFGRHAAHVRTAPARWPSWISVPGVAAAALGYVEVWHHAHERGHFKLVNPYMLGATATLFLALGGRRLIQRRFRDRRPHLLVTPSAVTYRASRLWRWTATWDDVAAVEHGPGELTLRLRTGGAHVLRADDHLDGGPLIAAARAAVETHAPARFAATSGPVPLSRS